MAVALSVVLGNVRLLELPSGGSIAFATLPLLALACTRGVRAGAIACCCAGAAHALAGGTIIHPAQLALDYLLAYAVLAVAGIASPAASSAMRSAAILLAMSLHLAAMVASGVIFFAPVTGDSALAYAIGYNAVTVVPEAVLALWLVPRLIRAVARANPTQAWRAGLLTPAGRPSRPSSSHEFHASAPQAALRARPAAVQLPPAPRIVARYRPGT